MTVPALKVAARAAIAACHGVEAAASYAGRASSTAGLWNNLHKSDLPPVDCALALDEVAVASGKAPPITAAMAHALGFVLVDPPEDAPTRGGWLARMGAIATATGALHAEFCAALADGGISELEAAALRAAIVAAQTELAALDAALPKGETR